MLVLTGLLSASFVATAQQGGYSAHPNELGVPIVEYFDTGELGFDVANFGCARDPRGIVWVANSFGLLEFDGADWRFHTSTINMPTLSVSCAKDGTVYFGLLGGFGRVILDSTGRFAMDLLSRRLPSNAPTLTRVDAIQFLGEDVWFGSTEVLCRWDGRVCTYILPQTAFRSMHSAHGRLYVQQDSIGLCVLSEQQVIPIPGGEIFKDPMDVIIMLQPFRNGEMIIATRRKGVFRYDGGRFQLLWEHAQSLGSAVPHCALRLVDGSLAFGTMKHGIWITDSTGTLLTIVDQQLSSNGVSYMMQDADQNIWAALKNGLVRVEWPSRTTYFGDELGINGQVAAITRFQGKLYAATTQGVYRLRSFARQQDAGNIERVQFHFIPGIQTTIYDLEVVGDEMLVASSHGVFALDPSERMRRITRRGGRVLLPVHGNTDTIAVGHEQGMYLLIRSSGNWRVVPVVEDKQDFVLAMCETVDRRIWYGTPYSRVVCIDAEMGILDPAIHVYDTSDGIPMGPNIVRAVRGSLLIISEYGTFTFDLRTQAFQLDDQFLSAFRPPLRYDPSFLQEDRENRIWMQLFGVKSVGYATVQDDGHLALHHASFTRLMNEDVISLHIDPDGICWFGTEDKVFRYDPHIRQPFEQPFRTMLRRVTVDGRILWYGNAGQTPAEPLDIDDDHRMIRIEFTAPTFGMRERLNYFYKREGFDTTWQSTERQPFIEYVQLPPGEYVIHIISQNAEGVDSEEVILRFTVLSPWYSSWWALMIGGVVLGFLLFGGPMLYRSRYLVERSQELETLVAERTKEIQTQAREIHRQAEELERLDSIVRTVNRETRMPHVLDALLMQSLLLFPHADLALFIRREIRKEEFRVVAAVGRGASELKDQRFTLRELVGTPDSSMQRMREGVYLLQGLGKRFFPGNGGNAQTHFMAMIIERARLLEGFLVLGSITQDTFGESDLHRLMRLKEHASSAVAKASAIEELEQKNRELDSTNRRLIDTQRQLVAHEKLAALGELTAGIAHEIQNPLNFVNNFSDLSCELLGELEQALPPENEGSGQTRKLIELIRSNCYHIREHGHRATTIVSAMIMHSRSGMSTRSTVVFNDLVDEFVMLAYHGMRLQYPQFSLDLHRDYDANVGTMSVMAQELSRAIVNICNNAWEAAISRAAEEGADLTPTVRVRSAAVENEVHLSITDNGHGIADDIRDRIFEPFFTTRRSGRNAGLGLSLSYDIITQLHSGKLTVQSTPGVQTEVHIVLPRDV